MLWAALPFLVSGVSSGEPKDSDPEHQYPMEQCGYWYQKDGWEVYKEQRDQCKWSAAVPAKDFFDPGTFYTGQSWDGMSVLKTWKQPLDQEIYIQECWFADPDPARSDEMWVVRRFGPYFATGQERRPEADGPVSIWQETKWHETMTPRYLTGRAFARYDAKTGKVLGSPPVHIHHEHIAYSECLPDFVPLLEGFKGNRLAASHGEQYGHGEDGVVFNVFKSLPLGMGKPMGFYTFDNKLADTRDENSEQMEFFQEVAFRMTPTERRKIYHMTRFNMGSLYTNLNLNVPTDTPSMFWTGFKMPADGSFITNWMHTHGLERVIIFKGDPKLFDLDGKYSKPDVWTMRKVDSIDSVVNELTSNAKAHGISWCEGTPQWEDVQYPEHTNQVKHARITKICCLPWDFKKGDRAAIVGFYDGRKAHIAKHQHFLFRGEYHLADEADGEDETLLMNNMQFCGEDPDTCVTEFTLGLKLSAVLLYGGNLPTNTWFNQHFGYVVALAIMAVLGCAGFLGVRWGLRRAGCVKSAGVCDVGTATGYKPDTSDYEPLTTPTRGISNAV